VWFLPHPWVNLFLPASRTAEVVAPTLADLTLADTGMEYGRDYPAFAAAKATLDPRWVLAPGQGIFGRPR
jgi:hypothetical protein